MVQVIAINVGVVVRKDVLAAMEGEFLVHHVADEEHFGSMIITPNNRLLKDVFLVAVQEAKDVQIVEVMDKQIVLVVLGAEDVVHVVEGER